MKEARPKQSSLPTKRLSVISFPRRRTQACWCVFWQRPNPSVERTRYGRPRLALISFWAKRGLPQRSAHLKR